MRYPAPTGVHLIWIDARTKRTASGQRGGEPSSDGLDFLAPPGSHHAGDNTKAHLGDVLIPRPDADHSPVDNDRGKYLTNLVEHRRRGQLAQVATTCFKVSLERDVFVCEQADASGAVDFGGVGELPRPPDPVDPNASPWHLLGANLRHWRDDICHLSQREAASRALCDDSDMSKWERGITHPRADTVARLDSLYGAGGKLTALHATSTELDRLKARTLKAETSARDEGDDMHRRAAMRLITALSAGTAIPPGTLEALCSGVEDAVSGHEGMSIDDWDKVIREHGYSYYAHTPGTLVHDLAADFAEVSRLLDRTPTPLTRTGLLRIGAQLAALLAMESSDIGDRRTSVRFWLMARRAADATGDRDLQVWVRGWEAEYGFWVGRAAPIIAEAADEAEHLANGTPSVGLAQALRARAYLAAARGDADTARIALRDMDQVFDGLPGSATSKHAMPLWSLREHNVSWSHAYASALVGDRRETVRATEQAIALCPPTYLGNIQHYQLVQSLALVGDGEIDEGLAHALTAAQSWPLSTTRRRTVGRIFAALPEKARTLDTARELHALTS